MAEKKEYVKLWMSYESYFEPYSDGEVGRLVLAMMEYRASGVEPVFNGNERYVWPAIKRDIDASIDAEDRISAVRSEAGRLGGRPKAKKPNAFPESKKSQGKGQGKGNGNGKGQGKLLSPPCVGDNSARAREEAVEAVLADYQDRINQTPSQNSLDALREYAEQMGEAVCKRAFDIALDNKITKWSYIQAILEDKLSRGIRSLEDWDIQEEKRKTGKKSTSTSSDDDIWKYIKDMNRSDSEENHGN